MSNIKLSDTLAEQGSEVSKQTNIINLIIANLFIIGSIVAFIVDAHNAILVLAGFCSLVVGIVICIKFNMKTIYVPTGSSIRERSKYIRYDRMEEIIEAMKKSNVNVAVKLEGSGDVRIDVVTSADGKYKRGMFFQYIAETYCYQPVSEPFEINDELMNIIFAIIDKL